MVAELEPKVLTAEEDEEQLIMRRMRNSVDELKRSYRWLDFRSDNVLKLRTISHGDSE